MYDAEAMRKADTDDLQFDPQWCCAWVMTMLLCGMDSKDNEINGFVHWGIDQIKHSFMQMYCLIVKMDSQAHEWFCVLINFFKIVVLYMYSYTYHPVQFSNFNLRKWNIRVVLLNVMIIGIGPE